MIPKEKAKFLVNRFNIILQNNELSIKCAIISVNEILNNDYPQLEFDSDKEYWQQVINELCYLD
jgi:hypothetical protein